MEEDEVRVAVTRGNVSAETRRRARRRVAALERYVPRGFLFAEVQLSHRETQAPPYVAHAMIDVQGRMVQGRTSADTPRECIDLLEDQLDTSLRRLRGRLVTRRQEPEETAEGHWRHGALPTRRPDHFDRPPEERQVIERVTHAQRDSTPEEAAFDLEMLDDDFLLYSDLDSGAEALVRRLDGRRDLGVSVVAGEPSPGGDGPYTFVVEPPPPRLTVGEAVERLRVGDEPHVFFVDARTGRGAVVYWRYDGHYGLVRPRGPVTS